MSNSDFKEQAEKYRQQMMKLYGSNNMSEKPPMPPVEEENVPNIAEETTTEMKKEENNSADDIEKRFPIPEIPNFIRENKPQNNSYGYLKVSVKTANGGIPIENSLVTISEMIDGRENVVRILTTDSSGSTEVVRLPAPENPESDTPESYESYAEYNISAYSDGYFRETSVGAPVFAGVTSIQNFHLIPEPFDYNSGERTIIDRNTEPTI